MKPGDLAIVSCSFDPDVDTNQEFSINGKIVLLLEWQESRLSYLAHRWLCLIDGKRISINAEWLKEIK